MNKLRVLFEGWGQSWPLGTLFDTGREVLFEYSPEAIAHAREHAAGVPRFQLSPLKHPIPLGGNLITYRGERAFHGLPGFIADALPDGWGWLLMDKVLRRNGRNPATVSVLERLALVGRNAIGALSFEPVHTLDVEDAQLSLKEVAQQIAAITNAASTSTDQAHLLTLLRLGGSPQGARPKALVQMDATTGAVSTLPAAKGAPWLVKFPAGGEHREVCALEELYARAAREGGLEMPQSRYFDLGRQHSAFGVERFDRHLLQDRGQNHTLRVPVMSFAAALEADYRLPSLDYETILNATLRITGDQRELLKAFERCVWNVLFHNRDDHAKNFALRMDAQGFWKLAPLFDFTFSHGPGGEHATSVLGHGKGITLDLLRSLGKKCGIKPKLVEPVLEKALTARVGLGRLARELPIRKASLGAVENTLATIH